MHEQSLASALVQQVVQLARVHAAPRVKEVKVVVGEFAGVEPALLESAFVRAAESGAARGARLLITSAPLRAQCHDCSFEFPVRRFTLICPACQGRQVVITQGEELLLDSVILETDS